MSHPQPPIREPTPKETHDYKITLHRAAIFTAIVCPCLAALPPRKLDVYTIGLVGLTGFSLNHLYRESRGQSILSLVSGSKTENLKMEVDTNLPTERAREFQRQLKAQREVGKVDLGDKEEKKGILEQVVYGDEKPEGWRQRRAAEDEKALAEGKGIGDIIMDQIWEVWTWGKAKESDGDKKE